MPAFAQHNQPEARVTAQPWQSTPADAGDEFRALRALLAALLVLVLATNLLSAWLRHAEAGVGCTPWPSCYARIDAPSTALSRPPIAVALQPADAVKQLHRTIATVLVVLVLLIIHQARRRQHGNSFEAMLPYALGAVTLLLAVVGPASYLKTRPGIAATNLLGGMLMLALTWRMLLGVRVRPAATTAVPRALALAALGAVAVQVALGAWASANFAGTVCSRAIACAPPADAGMSVEAFWYLRALPVDGLGHAVIGADTWLIQHAHRAGAVAAAIVLYVALTLRARRALPWHAAALTGLVGAQIVLGLVLVTRDLPMAAALAHLLLASLLVLTLIDLLHRTHRSRRHDRS